MNISVLRIRDNAVLPSYATPGSAAFDFTVAEDTVIAPSEIKLVPTGLVVAVPPGWFLAIFARSSAPLKRGLMLANGVGVLDSDYRGPKDELKIQLINVGKEPVELKAGERVAQGMVLQAPQVGFLVGDAETWGHADRGGFGSTGR